MADENINNNESTGGGTPNNTGQQPAQSQTPEGQVTPEQEYNQPTNPTSSKKSMMPKMITIGIIVILLVGGAIYGLQSGMFSVGGGAAVATVNGETIPRSEYEKRARLMYNYLESVGANLGTPERNDDGEVIVETMPNFLKKSVLQDLINEELILQHAEAEGITVTSEEIDEEYQNIVNQVGGEDQLLERLAKQDADTDELREILRKQLIRDKLAASVSDSYEVTDEEVRSYYEQWSAQFGEDQEVPAYEQVEGDLRLQLQQEKQQEILAPVLEQLQNQATVERNVDLEETEESTEEAQDQPSTDDTETPEE